MEEEPIIHSHHSHDSHHSHILEKMANQLIDMLPKLPKDEEKNMCNKTQVYHLVLDGGLFNGSYMVGSLYYLHVLEKRNKIKVGKISAVSIGSLCGLFYLINQLGYFDKIYNETYHSFKEHNDLTIAFPILDKILNILPKNVLQIVNHRLYISYYDMKKGRKITKHTYKSPKDLIETIKRSCYVPYIIGDHMFYKSRYMDGIMPYDFSRSVNMFGFTFRHGSKADTNTNILYIDLVHHFMDIISVKQEENNFYRMNVGLLDIHLLWLKNKSGAFCRKNANTFSMKLLCKHTFRTLLEIAIFYVFYFLYMLNKTKQALVASFIKTYCV